MWKDDVQDELACFVDVCVQCESRADFILHGKYEKDVIRTRFAG